MPEAITIKSDPAPAMAPDQEQTPEGDIQVQGEEPLLAGKYKTVDDLVKGYKELESERNRPEPEPEAVAEEAEPAEQSDDAPDANSIYGEYIGSRLTEAGIDFQNMNSRWQETGQLSDDDYNELGNAGFGRDMVDAYLSGLQFQQSQDSALAAQQVMQIKSEFGGEQAYQDMIQWAGENLSEGEQKAFNKSIASSDMDQVRFAVAGLQSRYSSQTGVEPRLVGGRSSRSSEAKFESTAQLVEAMQDPRYKTDPAYRRKLEEKLSRSNVF